MSQPKMKDLGFTGSDGETDLHYFHLKTGRYKVIPRGHVVRLQDPESDEVFFYDADTKAVYRRAKWMSASE